MDHVRPATETIAIVGLGYVGIALAISFGRKYRVVGYDTDRERISELERGKDKNLELEPELMRGIIRSDLPGCGENGIFLTSEPGNLKFGTTFIVTVPTPVDRSNCPDLSYLLAASEAIGKVLHRGDLVIYESTVYPGCTEEDCLPVLEVSSGLTCNEDFDLGYSPERLSMGDRLHPLEQIRKVTSGSNPTAAERVDQLYRSVITAGTYKAPSIKVAEASKVIENAQRDVNISFVNELALIFDRMGIDTHDVLDAAATKWNFVPYKPGLVGGHCIGVDPYYLAYKAQALGYHPQVLLSGRHVNDNMGAFIAGKVIKLMIRKGISVSGSNALILGFAFKENCADIRNTRVIDIVRELVSFKVNVTIYDPWVDPATAEREYGVVVTNLLPAETTYDALIVAVAHTAFLQIDYKEISKKDAVLFDTKAFIDRTIVDDRL